MKACWPGSYQKHAEGFGAHTIGGFASRGHLSKLTMPCNSTKSLEVRPEKCPCAQCLAVVVLEKRCSGPNLLSCRLR